MLKKNRKHLQKQSDDALVKHYRTSGDNAAMAVLFERFYHLVFGVCLKYLENTNDSKDMVITVFQKVMKVLPDTEIQHFKAWLYRLTQRECLMLLRKKKRIGKWQEEYEYLKKNKAEHADLEEGDMLEKKLSHLEEAVEQLKEAQQLCIKLFYIEEKCYKDIVAETGLSFKEVKSHIQNGKRNLKIILTQRNEKAV